MATLRAIVDGRTIDAQASPAAKHVGNQVQDPFGQTKDLFDDVHKKKMDYELAKQNLITQTAPTKAVLDQVSNIHELDKQPVSMTPGGGMSPNPMDSGMGYTDPNDPNQGVPGNMGQTPGQMNMNRPSQSGFQPGVAPGFPAQSVVPQKMGMPQPGEGLSSTKPGFPAGWTKNEPNPQQNQFNPQAQPPNGAKQLPGAKGPGDPKVGNQVNKAQGKPAAGGAGAKKKPGESGGKSNSSGKVNIQVHADRSVSGGSMPLQAWAGVEALRSCNDGRKMDAYTGGGMSGKNPKGTTTFTSDRVGNAPGGPNAMRAGKKRFKATFSKKEMEARRKMNAGGPGSGRRPGGGRWEQEHPEISPRLKQKYYPAATLARLGNRPGDDAGTYQVRKDKQQIDKLDIKNKPNKDFYARMQNLTQ